MDLQRQNGVARGDADGAARQKADYAGCNAAKPASPLEFRATDRMAGPGR
jgi:hypothetical protein